MRDDLYCQENIQRYGVYYLSGYVLGKHGLPRYEILEDRSPEETASDEFWRGYRDGVAAGVEGGWLFAGDDESMST